MNTNKIIRTYSLGSQWPMENPFLFCAHHLDDYPEGNEKMGPAVSLAGRQMGSDFSGKDGFSMYHGQTVPGFPAHPHRGFETVTIVKEGTIDHFDSKGNEGRYGSGDVQWMTAGAGSQHNEMFPLINMDKKNKLELFQIWLNLPSYSKFAEPNYKMLWAEDIPIFNISEVEGHHSQLKLIAGNFKGTQSLPIPPDSWAAKSENHVIICMIQMKSQAVITLPATSKTINCNLFFYQGKEAIQIDGFEITPKQGVKLDGNCEIVIRNGDTESFLLWLEGEPIHEPVVSHGPFVMNTEAEIRQTINDYHRTQFGGWPWASADQTHSRDEGRFTRYAEGRVERR